MSCNKFDLLSNLHVQKFEHLTPIQNIDCCWGDGYSTSISIYGGGGVRIGVQVLGMKFHTHTLKLGQSRMFSLITKKKKVTLKKM